eukprot:Sspe_Gene.109346::Locus_89410_Transcript_1_1_Confidence_1.000_Length_1652::g.109346::m.109346
MQGAPDLDYQDIVSGARLHGLRRFLEREGDRMVVFSDEVVLVGEGRRVIAVVTENAVYVVPPPEADRSATGSRFHIWNATRVEVSSGTATLRGTVDGEELDIFTLEFRLPPVAFQFASGVVAVHPDVVVARRGAPGAALPSEGEMRGLSQRSSSPVGHRAGSQPAGGAAGDDDAEAGVFPSPHHPSEGVVPSMRSASSATDGWPFPAPTPYIMEVGRNPHTESHLDDSLALFERLERQCREECGEIPSRGARAWWKEEPPVVQGQPPKESEECVRPLPTTPTTSPRFGFLKKRTGTGGGPGKTPVSERRKGLHEYPSFLSPSGSDGSEEFVMKDERCIMEEPVSEGIAAVMDDDDDADLQAPFERLKEVLDTISRSPQMAELVVSKGYPLSPPAKEQAPSTRQQHWVPSSLQSAVAPNEEDLRKPSSSAMSEGSIPIREATPSPSLLNISTTASFLQSLPTTVRPTYPSLGRVPLMGFHAVPAP